MVALVVPLAPSAGAITIGEGDGCTPGFWKNHTKSWQEYSPSDTIAALNLTFPAGYEHLEDYTLLQALSWGGGPTLEDAMKNLLKHTVTAYLNAAHDDLSYPYRRFGTGVNGRPSLQSLVSNALLSLDRDTILDVKDELDATNNGNCKAGGPNTTGKGKKKAKKQRARR